jgi:hypothetical protein
VFAVVAFVLVALWALTGAGYFWPVWPLGFWALGVLKHPGARRRRQPRGQWV